MRVGATLLFIELLLGSATAVAAAPSAQSVLAAASRAMGRFDPKTSMEARGEIEAEGRTGKYREAVRPRDGAFLVSKSYSLFGESDGYDGRVRWWQDRSGASHVQDAPFTIADSISTAWLKRRGYLNPSSARIEAVKRDVIDGK